MIVPSSKNVYSSDEVLMYLHSRNFYDFSRADILDMARDPDCPLVCFVLHGRYYFPIGSVEKFFDPYFNC